MTKKRIINKWYFSVTYKRGKKKYLDECIKRLHNWVNSSQQTYRNKYKDKYKLSDEKK